uniref:COP1-interacting protein 7 n=1 Tax=Erigeron canadensis TaxID=72917 RepID=UPI001CB9837A|nr:COP1-interacting protein 7 [Erigeron canadensis]
MKSKTRLDSAVFQLTPTRTRCDLYIIANDKKEKIASGLLNPFIAHLKTAQDQIAEGGYSVLLAPETGSNATWFTKGTVESFVRFVSTPEILERVYIIESEILQIEEAISIQGNNDIQVEDRLVKPVAVNEENKPAYDADTEKAIVLYKPGAQETTVSNAKEGNSKVQLLHVLETRKTVLKKEQGMAFARAVAAGFEIDHITNLLSFAECFGASRLMNACLRFMDLWKRKHESGQWVDIEAEDAMSGKLDYSTMNASGIVLSSMTNGPNEPRGDATSETKETVGGDPNAGGEQQYHGGQSPNPGFPPWGMHTSLGSVPVYQAYPMPYYQHYPGTAPFYPPPPYPSMEDPLFHLRHSMEHNNRYTSPEPDEGSELQKDVGKSGKSRSGKVVIRNINFINSKNQNSSGDDSESASDSDIGDEIESRNNGSSLRSSKRKGNRKESESETRNRKEIDSGPWDAFQSYLLKGVAEGDRSANEDMFAMEKDSKTNRLQKSMAADPLAHVGRDDDGEGKRIDMQSFDRNGRKILYRSGNDDFLLGRREQAYVRDPLVDNGFEGATANLDRNGLHAADEAVMVSLRSTSGVNDHRSSMNMDLYDLPSSNTQNPENISNKQVITYEPDALSLMPERDLEKRPLGYDPALDYEMQLAEDAAVAASREKMNKTEVKKGSKSAEKHQPSKANQGPSLVRKGRPSKVNNTIEDARARAEKLRSYKADLQKMRKEQQDAELKRLEALKMERQKRIAARANSSKQQLPSKLSPMSHRGFKFTDSEPGSSSPLQRSKIRPTSIGSTISKKSLTSSTKLADGNHSAGNRLTRSLSSMSDTKKESSSVIPDSKASMTRIRRLSEPKKINNIHVHTTIKTRSAEPVSKPKLSNGPESKKISAIINLDQTKAASLPELKIRTSKASSNLTQKVKVKEDKTVGASEVAKVNLNDRFNVADGNPIIDKTVVMLEHKRQSSLTKEYVSNHGTEVNVQEVPLSMEIIDKGTISVHPQKHHTSGEVNDRVENLGENPGTSSSYQAPYARVSSFEDPSTRNSEYAKAPPSNFGMTSGAEKTYISDFNNLKLEKIPEVLEKPQPKGFRRLLMLGKKSHTPSDTATSQPDNLTFTAPASAEVHTLKTLISEDQAPIHGHASQKSSKHFSLLSSFRGKTTEKKPTA